MEPVKFLQLTSKNIYGNTFTGSNDFSEFGKMGIDMKDFFKPKNKQEELLNPDRENGGFKVLS